MIYMPFREPRTDQLTGLLIIVQHSKISYLWLYSTPRWYQEGRWITGQERRSFPRTLNDWPRGRTYDLPRRLSREDWWWRRFFSLGLGIHPYINCVMSCFQLYRNRHRLFDDNPFKFVSSDLCGPPIEWRSMGLVQQNPCFQENIPSLQDLQPLRDVQHINSKTFLSVMSMYRDVLSLRYETWLVQCCIHTSWVNIMRVLVVRGVWRRRHHHSHKPRPSIGSRLLAIRPTPALVTWRDLYVSGMEVQCSEWQTWKQPISQEADLTERAKLIRLPMAWNESAG